MQTWSVRFRMVHNFFNFDTLGFTWSFIQAQWIYFQSRNLLCPLTIDWISSTRDSNPALFVPNCTKTNKVFKHESHFEYFESLRPIVKWI